MTNDKRFKANVRAVQIEPHSYCNRKCWFCPNNFIDRTGPVKFMDQAMYLQILSDLASIEYSEILSFVGWCEPFSQPSFLDRIKEASDYLPNAFLTTNSNSDYLTTEIVQQAAENGLHLLLPQLYFEEDEDYTADAVSKKFDKLEAKLPGIEFKEWLKSHWYALVEGKMVVHVRAKDFRVGGVNRCDLPIIKAKKIYHTCTEGVQFLGIDYTGWAVPCCQIRSDYLPHKDLLLGCVGDEPGDIFDVYQGLILPEQQYPCVNCAHHRAHPNIKLLYTKILEELKNEQLERIRVTDGCEAAICSDK